MAFQSWKCGVPSVVRRSSAGPLYSLALSTKALVAYIPFVMKMSPAGILRLVMVIARMALMLRLLLRTSLASAFMRSCCESLSPLLLSRGLRLGCWVREAGARARFIGGAVFVTSGVPPITESLLCWGGTLRGANLECYEGLEVWEMGNGMLVVLRYAVEFLVADGAF